jgi:hypothetical protein
LLAALAALRTKQDSVINGLDLWRGFARQYPSYDPHNR